MHKRKITKHTQIITRITNIFLKSQRKQETKEKPIKKGEEEKLPNKLKVNRFIYFYKNS